MNDDAPHIKAVQDEPEPELESLLRQLTDIRCQLAEEAQHLHHATERLHRRSGDQGEGGEPAPEPQSYAERLNSELDALRYQVKFVQDSRLQLERAI